MAGPLRQGQIKGLPTGCGDLDFVSQKCLGQLYLLGHGDVVILNGNALGQGGGGFDVEVAHRSAVGAGFALTCQPDFLSLGQPLGNLYLNGLGMTALVDGNCFLAAVDQLLNGQRNFILKVFAPDRGLTAASAATAAHVLGEWVAAPAAETGTALAKSTAASASAESEFLKNIAEVKIPENIFLGKPL